MLVELSDADCWRAGRRSGSVCSTRRLASDGRVGLGMAPIALDEDHLELVGERSQLDLRSSLAGMPAEIRAMALWGT